jgi:uncharacterized protein (DUF1015 family)
MSMIRPFRGLRPRKEFAHRIASPPYDVLDSDEARDIVKDNPLSFLRVVKPEVDLDPGIDLYSDEVYRQGAVNLRRLVEEGLMVQDQVPHLYFYRQIMGGHSQTGLVTCVSADEYDRDLIRKHEHTRKAKEEDRIRHIMSQNAQAGPVFLTYRDIPEVDRIERRITSGEPEYDFTASDGVRHTLWIVENRGDIDTLVTCFRDEAPFLYVADGHHRSASGALVARLRRQANPSHTGLEEYNFILAVVFPKSQLRILPYNRVVRDLNGMTPGQFLEAVSRSFIVTRSGKASPLEPREFSMYLEGQWYTLAPIEGTYEKNDPVESLDVSVLQKNLLEPLLGISDPRTSDRIDFIGGIRGTGELVRLVDSGRFAVAFSIYPTSLDQLLSVADSGRVMPPKSTWFEPKLRSGLVVHGL